MWGQKQYDKSKWELQVSGNQRKREQVASILRHSGKRKMEPVFAGLPKAPRDLGVGEVNYSVYDNCSHVNLLFPNMALIMASLETSLVFCFLIHEMQKKTLICKVIWEFKKWYVYFKLTRPNIARLVRCHKGRAREYDRNYSGVLLIAFHPPDVLRLPPKLYASHGLEEIRSFLYWTNSKVTEFLISCHILNKSRRQ